MTAEIVVATREVYATLEEAREKWEILAASPVFPKSARLISVSAVPDDDAEAASEATGALSAFAEKPGDEKPATELTWSEYYAAFAETCFRMIRVLFADPANWMRTFNGGWNFAEGAFRSKHMLAPEPFAIALVLGQRAVEEARRRLSDGGPVELKQ